jgi:hypothetical protein
LRAAIAAMRPLIAAEPMLRAPSPEIVPESTTTGGIADAGGAASLAADPDEPAVIVWATGVPAAGNLNAVSSTGTLSSMRSIVMCVVLGAPCAPLSIENGNHMPSTCL